MTAINSIIHINQDPPWDRNILKSTCKGINQDRGYREKKYTELLQKISDQLSKYLSLSEYIKLGHNLISIQNRIPKGVQQRDKLSQVFSTCTTKLCSHFVQHVQAIQEKAEAKITFKTVETHLSDIKKIEESLPQKASSELSTSLKKCRNFCEKKLELLQYVSSLPHTDAQNFYRREIVPILSIDGGGIRGIIPATILKEIETITKKPIARLFKLIGGTSTGGILALGLTKPRELGSQDPHYSAGDLLDLYVKGHGTFFETNALADTKYVTPSAFADKFGVMKAAEALTDILITTNSIEAIGQKIFAVGVNVVSGAFSFLRGMFGYSPSTIYSHDSIPRTVHFFNKTGMHEISYSLEDLEKKYYERKLSRAHSIHLVEEKSFPMKEMAQMTSAAPSFFPHVPYQGRLFMDGGVLQNNPAIPCIMEAMNKGHQRDRLFMVSIGTGEGKRIPRTKEPKDLGMLFWFETTQPNLRQDMLVGSILETGACHRLQIRFQDDPPGLDDVSKIDELQQIANNWVAENRAHIREICRVLDPDCA